jgi:hypothetical protein
MSRGRWTENSCTQPKIPVSEVGYLGDPVFKKRKKEKRNKQTEKKKK